MSCVILLLVFVIRFVNPVVAEYSVAHVQAMTVKATNNAIAEVITKETFMNLVDIRREVAGRITSISTNYVEMNYLTGRIAFVAQQKLESNRARIPVPMGTFTGLPALSGVGPAVNLRVTPVGAVNCGFNATFIEAGINQTRHRIVLMVRSTVNVIMPLGSRVVETEIEVVLAESIIVGEVPEFLFR